ncbi:hypothetical protein V5799_010266 [Amblyomma americanum]|uniref:Uncharacterized protein n=1 Tax=Amblyomma americanum TaxID=6943 RepID=A0AAQ4F853_AMBAM
MTKSEPTLFQKESASEIFSRPPAAASACGSRHRERTTSSLNGSRRTRKQRLKSWTAHSVAAALTLPAPRKSIAPSRIDRHTLFQLDMALSVCVCADHKRGFA